MKRKLCSSGGYTMPELLAALAVLAIMLSALGAGTAASVTVYRQSSALSEANVLTSTLFEAIADELRFAADITTADDGDPATADPLDTFTSTHYGIEAGFSNEDGRIRVSGRDLIGEKTYTGLDAAADIRYSFGVFAVRIVVTDPNQDSAECGRAEFSIAPLNP